MNKTDLRLKFVDQLIIDAIEHGMSNFEDILSYAGRNYSGDRPQPFVAVVERRQQALRRKGAIQFDRRAKSWSITNKTLVEA